MGIARYNTDGSLDNVFGKDGKVTIYFESRSRGQSLLIQNDGKIIISGSAYIFTDNSDFAIARCLANGSLDAEFGIEGKTTTDISLYDNTYSSLLQQDGKIILLGQAYDGINIANFAMVRYHGDPVENPVIAQLKTWLRNNTLGWYTSNNSKRKLLQHTAQHQRQQLYRRKKGAGKQIHPVYCSRQTPANSKPLPMP